MSSFQNLSEAEKEQIVGTSDKLKKDLASAAPVFKAMTIGFALLNIAGEENFSDLVDDLVAYLKKRQPISVTVAAGS
jgi:hypothetical protein